MDSFWYEVGMYLSIAGAAIGITLLAASPTLSFGTTTANAIMDLARYGGAYGTTFM